MISRTNEKEPRLQVGRTGVPFFGRDFENVSPGEAIELDESDLGSPVDSLSEIPPGDYFVQGFINVYSEFPRADGHTVWMHDDQWEGQRFWISAGNLHSVPVRLTLDAEAGYDHELVLDQIIPEVELPPDTVWVKRFRFESEILTKFWGTADPSRRHGAFAARLRAREHRLPRRVLPGAFLHPRSDAMEGGPRTSIARGTAITFRA